MLTKSSWTVSSEQHPGHPRLDIGSTRKKVILILLSIIYGLNFLDRQIIIILQEPIKIEFGLADWQLGAVTGGVVGLFYTTMLLPLAKWADGGVNRTRLIAAATAAWSVMTLLCGFCRTFIQLLLARIGVGMTEAAFVPSAHSLIADMYSTRERPHAMGIFSVGLPIGMMAGLAIGGLIAQATSWRVALFAAGAPGILTAGLFLMIAREPRRGAMDTGPVVQEDRPGFLAGLNVLRRRRPIFHLIAGMAACTFVQTGIMTWLPSFLIRVHGMDLGQAGVSIGLISGVCGAAGTVLGGWQAVKMGRSGQHRLLWLPMVGILISIPLYAFIFLAQSASVVLALLAATSVLSALWTAPSLALIQNHAPVALRAQASALASMTASLLGMSLGPIAVGIFSDIFSSYYGGNTGLGLRAGLLTTLPLFAIVIWQWLAASRAIRAEECPKAI